MAHPARHSRALLSRRSNVIGTPTKTFSTSSFSSSFPSRGAGTMRMLGLNRWNIAARAGQAPCRSLPMRRASFMHVLAVRRRSKSTETIPPSSCPRTFAASEHDASARTQTQPPELVRVPSLPYIGSLLPFHSGVPPYIMDPYKFLPAMNRKFGNFYSMGLPSIGNPDDRYATLYVIRDPNEMAKVVRAGGAYPSGLLQQLWPNRGWSEENGVLAGGTDGGFFGQTEDWKRLRTFMQTDLLHPDSARGYIPGIIKAAQLASAGAADAAASTDEENEALNHYFNRCAFDMFSSLMLGIMTNTADMSTPTDRENVDFVEATKLGLSTAIQIWVDPLENILGKVLGIKTRRRHEMTKAFDVSYQICMVMMERFMEKKRDGLLNEMEEASYLSRAIDRQSQEGSDVTLKELMHIAYFQLFAAVDTTSSAVAWNVIHMALNPDVQQTLYEELRCNIDAARSGGELVPSVLERKNAPYLHSILRETHRLTPNGPIYLFKRLTGYEPVTIHGESLSPGSVVAMEGMSASHDPCIVSDPAVFRPERWSNEEVERRKGTPSEIVDHLYYRDAFSQGPRKCPGSRVATNEILVMLSQLVLDWRIIMPEGVELEDIKYEQRTSVEPTIPRLVFEPRF